MPTTPHLAGAIRNFLLGNPAIATQLTGGIADGQAARDTPLPYCVIEIKDSNSMRIFGGKEVYFATVFLSIFAAGRNTAETVGNAIRDAILPPDDEPAWSPLGLAEGWIDANRQPAGGESVEIDPETRAAFGVDVWVCHKPISWTLSRG